MTSLMICRKLFSDIPGPSSNSVNHKEAKGDIDIPKIIFPSFPGEAFIFAILNGTTQIAAAIPTAPSNASRLLHLTALQCRSLPDAATSSRYTDRRSATNQAPRKATKRSSGGSSAARRLPHKHAWTGSSATPATSCIIAR